MRAHPAAELRRLAGVLAEQLRAVDEAVLDVAGEPGAEAGVQRRRLQPVDRPAAGRSAASATGPATSRPIGAEGLDRGPIALTADDARRRRRCGRRGSSTGWKVDVLEPGGGEILDGQGLQRRRRSPAPDAWRPAARAAIRPPNGAPCLLRERLRARWRSPPSAGPSVRPRRRRSGSGLRPGSVGSWRVCYRDRKAGGSGEAFRPKSRDQETPCEAARVRSQTRLT